MNQDFTVQKKSIFVWEKNRAEGLTWKKNPAQAVSEKQNSCKLKIPPPPPHPPPHPITFLMVRPLAVDGQQAMVL